MAKTGNGNYLFGLSKKLTFWEIDTSNGNGKGQEVTVKDRCHTLSVLYRYHCLLW